MNASASKNVREYGHHQLMVSVLIAWGAVYFTFAALTSDNIIMAPSIYGEWVTGFQAEYWSIPILISALVHILGVKINGMWRWSGLLRVVGCVINAAVLLSFVGGALGSSMGDPVVAFGGGFAIAYIWFTMLNIGDLSRAIKSW